MFDFPDTAGIQAAIAPALDALGPAARVERLGNSHAGAAIDLISIGEGDCSILVVGGPHANEPLGCLAIISLINTLAHGRVPGGISDFSWHFIPVIDPDGLDLNSGWLRGPATLQSYMRHFFRPAFSRQAEYGFPLEMPGYRFDAPSPENICWQRALEISRPDLQVSLHGSDTGGAFFILSEDRPGLAPRLSRAAKGSGLGLNRHGEPEATMHSYAPGVFSAFEVQAFIKEATAAGREGKDVWTAGQSSTEFAMRNYASLCLVSEVPLWHDTREANRRASSFTMRDAAYWQWTEAVEDGRLLERAADLLALDQEAAEDAALCLALREAAALAPSAVNAANHSLQTADGTVPLRVADLVHVEPGTAMMRTAAMLARFAQRRGAVDLAAAARSLLDERMARYLQSARLQPAPVARAVSLQRDAILAAAGSVMRG